MVSNLISYITLNPWTYYRFLFGINIVGGMFYSSLLDPLKDNSTSKYLLAQNFFITLLIVLEVLVIVQYRCTRNLLHTMSRIPLMILELFTTVLVYVVSVSFMEDILFRIGFRKVRINYKKKSDSYLALQELRPIPNMLLLDVVLRLALEVLVFLFIIHKLLTLPLGSVLPRIIALEGLVSLVLVHKLLTYA